MGREQSKGVELMSLKPNMDERKRTNENMFTIVFAWESTRPCACEQTRRQ